MMIATMTAEEYITKLHPELRETSENIADDYKALKNNADKEVSRLGLPVCPDGRYTAPLWELAWDGPQHRAAA